MCQDPVEVRCVLDTGLQEGGDTLVSVWASVAHHDAGQRVGAQVQQHPPNIDTKPGAELTIETGILATDLVAPLGAQLAQGVQGPS